MATVNKSEQHGLLAGDLSLQMGDFYLHSGEFEFPLNGVSVIFGRSGSGKSTLLKAITGLDKRTSGWLKFGDEVWQHDKKSMPTQKRNIGFVFQDAALFPHMSVRENLRYGLKRLPKSKESFDFNTLVKDIDIDDKLDRSVEYLSGGEKQRVAIARALLMQPELLCMDEPLSALDWRAKADILTLIEEVVDKYKIPVLYITHSPAEVERLADRIVFMHEGRIERIETLQQALSRPDSPLFDDEGVASVLEGQARPIEDGLRPIAMGENILWLSDDRQIHKQQVRVRVVAKDVSLALTDPQNLSIMNHLPAQILELIEEDNQRVLVRLELADKQKLFAEITSHSATRLGLEPGMHLFALIKSVALAE